MPRLTTDDWKVIARFHRQLWPAVSLSPTHFMPECVYHYTTAAGFAGIITSSSIRATNFSFLNDPSEVTYGRELLQAVLHEAETTLPQTLRAFASHVREALATRLVTEVYVACFTELDDDLSQWRAYGSSASERYSIGFKAEALERLSEGPDASFARVVYREAAQRERLHVLLREAVHLALSEKLDGHKQMLLATALVELIERVLPELKNPSYEREDEWRLIFWRRTERAAHFDTTRGVLRPYIEVAFSSLPLIRLCVMAPTRRDASLKAATMLLRKEGLVGVEPRHSRVPFAE